MLKAVWKLMNRVHAYHQFEKKRTQYSSKVSLPKELSGLSSAQLPDIESAGSQLNYLVVDFETTGLDASTDSILSVGWVEVNWFSIDLASAQHLYIDTTASVNADGAVVNHIVPEMLKGGVPLDEAMQRLFEAARNRILIAHGAVIEASFVEEYLSHRFGLKDVPILWIDTLAIEKSMAKAVNADSSIDVRLAETRERHGLPEYNGHEALIDAIATAELFLAQQTRLFDKSYPCIGKLYRMSR
ncbi:exonuclease domain-containing protein [Vibrio maritimus]